MTRRINAHLEMSLDGVVDHPERWAHAYFVPEMLEAAQQGMSQADTLLLFGRRTYEEFAAVWPSQDPDANPFVRFLNDTPKVVISSTPIDLSWGPAEQISRTGDVAELKTKPGGDVLILGSATLVGSLLRAGLLDLLDLFVIPVLIGTGKRLLESPDQVPLKLVESGTFPNGVLSLRYAGESRG
jgi:dihydrofolate reductase